MCKRRFPQSFTTTFPSVCHNAFPLLYPPPPPHKKPAMLTKGFVNTVLCHCKISPLALIPPVIYSLTTSHVLLLVPCHGFAFLMVRWRVKESTVALWRERESAGFLCDVCCEIAAVSPEETQTAQRECTLKALLSLAEAGRCF